MNMNKITNVLIGLLILLVACKNSEKETPNGLKFKIVKEGNGVLPKKEEFVVFEFVMKDSKDSVWNSTFERGMPGILMIADSSQIAQEDGMEQMFRMLSKGDSAVVTMPITKLFRDLIKQPIPPNVDTTLNISYLVRIDNIIGKDSIQAFQTNLITKKSAAQKAKDEKLISEYLAKNNITAERDTTGLHYVLHTSKGGQKPTDENCVQVNYAGKFLDNGQIFDKNDGISFPLNGVIAGWRYGIPKLGIGDSATLYIPSGLAYGPQGIPGAMPPDAVLVFDVELLKIGSGYDDATRSCK